jgi:hypothetical protein
VLADGVVEQSHQTSNSLLGLNGAVLA